MHCRSIISERGYGELEHTRIVKQWFGYFGTLIIVISQMGILTYKRLHIFFRACIGAQAARGN